MYDGGQVTSSLNLPLYSKVCLINAVVFVAAATVLVISPATVSAQVTAGEVAVLSCGLIVIVAANALLLRGVLAPLDRLIQRMDRFSIGTPASGCRNAETPSPRGSRAASTPRSHGWRLSEPKATPAPLRHRSWACATAPEITRYAIRIGLIQP